ncbi:hypothetical protein ACSBR1_013182 [Camellia fascicularis]
MDAICIRKSKEMEQGAEKQGTTKCRGTANREDEGWIPVFRQKQRRSTGNTSIHTLFVDNLPKPMDPNDGFIPLKRRKTARSRFGFIHYDSHIAAKVAIQKANVVWCDNRSLVVKSTAFRRSER